MSSSSEQQLQEFIHSDNEIDKLKVLIDKSNELKLIKQKDNNFKFIQEAISCAIEYWYSSDNINDQMCIKELMKYEILAIITLHTDNTLDWIQVENKLQEYKAQINQSNKIELVHKKDKKFTIIDEALFCAGRYWGRENEELLFNKLNEIYVVAAILQTNTDIIIK